MIARDAFMRKVSTRCFVALLAAACAPELADDTTLVTAPRVIAAVADPPELHPRAMVQIHVVPAPDAAGATPELTFCTTPATIGDPRPVSEACLAEKGIPLSVDGLVATGAIPADTCSRFGPDPISSSDRPRDPDATGGYYQPLRVDLDEAAPTFHLQRILCGLADASAATVTEYGKSYLPNTNPALGALRASLDGAPLTLDRVPAGARVELSASWGDADAESYIVFDRTARELVTQRESLRVSWHSSGGRFDTESTGRAENDSETTSSNAWLAPDIPGTYQLWIVLRDARGGSDFATYDVVVLR